MMDNRSLKDLLLEKVNKEHDEYIKQLMTLSPDEIINRAYEKVMYDDIAIAIEYSALLQGQIIKLLNLEYPLSACYSEWQKRDETYMDRLVNTVEEFAEKLIGRE